MIEQDLDSQLMAIAAHRYCLGRRSYIVSSCIDWLTKNWNDIQPGHQTGILKDTQAAIDADHAGDDMDKRGWIKFVEAHTPKETQE